MDNSSLQVFVTSPIGTTQTVRNLNCNTSLSAFQAKLELITGFPSGTYTLKHGHKTIPETEPFLFKKDVQNGAVLRMYEKPPLERVIGGIKAEDEAGVCEACSSMEDDVTGMDTGKAFIAACICANLGLQVIVNRLLEKDSGILSASTINGRNIAHITAAADRPQTLFDVLMSSVKGSVNLLVADNFHKTPSDIAKENRAIICDRMIREYVYKKRTGQLRSDILAKSNTKEKGLAVRKPRAKSALPHYSRAKSTSSIDSMAKTNRGSEAVSSGYHTQEDIPERCASEINKLHLSAGFITDSSRQETSEEKRSSSPKRVKFMKRVKSAPASQHKYQQASPVNDDRPAHVKCYSGKPFMAYRSVPEDELRPLAVEFVALPHTNIVGMDQKSREKQVRDLLQERSVISPFSSLSNSLQDLTDVESVKSDVQSPSKRGTSPEMQYTWRQSRIFTSSQEDNNANIIQKKKALQTRYTNPKTTTKRAQSAKYYKASYHKRREVEIYHETIPPPRPKTANSRYRAWKPWLLEKYKNDEEITKQESDPQNIMKKLQSAQAYHEWKARKYAEGQLDAQETESSGSDDEATPLYSSEWAKAYYAAFENDEDLTFEKWLQLKAKMFKEMDKRTLMHRRGETDAVPKQLLDRRVTIYEIGSTDATPMKIDDPETYMRAYQKWKSRKIKYEHWKKRQGLVQEETSRYTSRDMEDMRRALYLDGFAYNQWLGQVDREEQLANRQQRKAVQFRFTNF